MRKIISALIALTLFTTCSCSSNTNHAGAGSAVSSDVKNAASTESSTAYFVSSEVISFTAGETSDQTLVHNVPLLYYVYKGNAFQPGDSLTVKVTMSDGGSRFLFCSYDGGPYIIEGNRIRITAKSESEFVIYANDRYGSVEKHTVLSTHNMLSTGSLTDEMHMHDIIADYCTSHNLYISSSVSGYTMGKKYLSLTGYKGSDYDDKIDYSADSGKYVEQIFDLIDNYQKKGFQSIWFQYYDNENGFKCKAQ